MAASPAASITSMARSKMRSTEVSFFEVAELLEFSSFSTVGKYDTDSRHFTYFL
jgi:hypothetical protein